MAKDTDTAPVYKVPRRRIVNIEHPCQVKNLDNGLKSLGGESQLRHVLDHRVGDSLVTNERKAIGPEPVAGVSLRPNDPYAKKLASVGVQTRNVLVRITAPKRTGRKRKRGTNDPFAEDHDPSKKSITTQDMLQSMRDNPTVYEVEALGMIPETHRFRSLPDLQLRGNDQPIMQEIKSRVLSGKYDDFKRFAVDLRPGPSNALITPAPPSFTLLEQPYNYEYHQAPGVVFRTDPQGHPFSENTMANNKMSINAVPADAPSVPTIPPNPSPLHKRHPRVLECYREMQSFLSKRPLASKRVLVNSLPQFTESMIKELMPYVGYSFKRGPFRDQLIAYGTDPRTDPKYRIYQTMYFQFEKDIVLSSRRNKNANHLPDDDLSGHFFDGKVLSTKGMTWQVCDVTDPLISSVLSTSQFRTEIEPHQWGFFHAGTLTKARVLMKEKMRRILNNETIPDAEYAPILRLPEKIEEGNTQMLYYDESKLSKNIVVLPGEIRSQLRSAESLRKERGLPPEVPHFLMQQGGGAGGAGERGREKEKDGSQVAEEDEEVGDLDDVGGADEDIDMDG